MKKERERERDETAIVSVWEAANPDENGFMYFTDKSVTCYLVLSCSVVQRGCFEMPGAILYVRS
jgi:hypothetical protein